MKIHIYSIVFFLNLVKKIKILINVNTSYQLLASANICNSISAIGISAKSYISATLWNSHFLVIDKYDHSKQCINVCSHTQVS